MKLTSSSKKQALAKNLDPLTTHSDPVSTHEFILFFNPRSGSQRAKRYRSLTYYQYTHKAMKSRIALFNVTEPADKEMGVNRMKKLGRDSPPGV